MQLTFASEQKPCERRAYIRSDMLTIEEILLNTDSRDVEQTPRKTRIDHKLQEKEHNITATKIRRSVGNSVNTVRRRGVFIKLG